MKTQEYHRISIRWREAEVIGNGSFGRVVLGLNRDNGEIMAVKQVHIGGLSSQIIQDVSQMAKTGIINFNARKLMH